MTPEEFWAWAASVPEAQRGQVGQQLRDIYANWLRSPIELYERGQIPFTLSQAPAGMTVEEYNQMIQAIMQKLGYYPQRFEELSMMAPEDLARLRSELGGMTPQQLQQFMGEVKFGRLAPVERQFELGLRNLPTEMQRIIKSNLELEAAPMQVWEEMLSGEEAAKATMMQDFLSEWRRQGARPEEIRSFVPQQIKQAFYAMPAAERGERVRGFAVGRR